MCRHLNTSVSGRGLRDKKRHFESRVTWWKRITNHWLFSRAACLFKNLAWLLHFSGNQGINDLTQKRVKNIVHVEFSQFRIWPSSLKTLCNLNNVISIMFWYYWYWTIMSYLAVGSQCIVLRDNGEHHIFDTILLNCLVSVYQLWHLPLWFDWGRKWDNKSAIRRKWQTCTGPNISLCPLPFTIQKTSSVGLTMHCFTILESLRADCPCWSGFNFNVFKAFPTS